MVNQYAKRCKRPEDVPKHMLFCLAFQHAWDDRPAHWVTFLGGQRHLYQRRNCTNGCGVWRSNYVDPTDGETWGQSYQYPDWFGCTTRRGKAEYRKVWYSDPDHKAENVEQLRGA